MTAPFDEIESLVPEDGHVLDFGSGYGLLAHQLALRCSGRRVVCVEVDADKAEVASTASAVFGLGSRVDHRLVVSDLSSLDEVIGPTVFDAAVVVDVLYLLEVEDVKRLISALASRLGTGGVLIVKEMAERPRWKRVWTEVQERVSIRVLGITMGQSLKIHSVAVLSRLLTEAGLDVSVSSIDHGYLHPHVMLVARRR